MRAYIFSLLIPVFLGAGCTSAMNGNSSMNTVGNMSQTNMPGNGNAAMSSMVRLAGKMVMLDNVDQLKPGVVTFAFTLYDDKGVELTPNELKTIQTKKVHLLIVRDDMTGYQHIHPEYLSKKWTVSTTIPEAGEYQLYVDVEPIKEKTALILRVPVMIGGPTQTKSFPVPNERLSAQNGDYVAALKLPAPLKSGNKEIELTIALTKNGNPITNLQPYLGELGHLIIIRQNGPDVLEHAHPMSDSAPNGEVVFEGLFPKSGRYTLYAQFNVGGTIMTFPITIDAS